jgi:3-hydroxyacyl-[acyl-carrier-protein] dehydratase
MIPATHPSLDGHFPGEPVVPGVLILDEILIALKQWLPDTRVLGFQGVKFLRIIKPGNMFTVTLEQTTHATVRFKCHSGKMLLNTGTVILKSEQQRI